MSASVDRASRRAERRSQRAASRPTKHKPLLKLVNEELTKVPVKPTLKPVRPLNEAQRVYDVAMATNSITFGIGPAGTGKTWLAAVRAADALRDGEIEKIIVTRPAQEAGGESLGFLPGDLNEKYEPYFRPVKDALEERLGSGALEYMIKSKIIEARPLALLRGATLKNCWVLADEMQNANKVQMMLLLTRIGENARFIINGDPAQCDLPNISQSGLIDAVRRLGHIKGVATVEFTVDDIVRSGICQEIVKAYSRPAALPQSVRYNDDSNEKADAGLLRALGFDEPRNDNLGNGHIDGSV